MPVKRRRSKQRVLTRLMMTELWYGPGTCLLAGAGYWHGEFYLTLSEEAKQAVLNEMREDWFRHQDQVIERWDNRTDHELYLAREHREDPLRPWAETEFGLEECEVRGALKL